MNSTLSELLYLAAAVLFILGLKRLSGPKTARTGNRLAALGMLVAIVVTLLDNQVVSYGVVVAGLVAGGAIGLFLARQVEMTAMPQLVAAFNGFGGGASALVAAAEFLTRDLDNDVVVAVLFSTVIGTITFAGSFVAFAKLQGLLPGKPLTFPGHVAVDGVLAAGVLGTAVWALAGGGAAAFWLLMGLSFVLGISRVVPIGGADMPVVVAFLNSLSGLAASAAGFVISSNALIISGALVGASGLILTAIMSKGMNRSLADVLFGAFGGGTSAPQPGDTQPVRKASVEDVAISLAFAQSVVVVPGYGLAVAQAQHAMRELADRLGERGVEVRYAIHPVAGRMPGHMNVLLAEADVPYEALADLDDINDDFDNTDVALIVGANDVVNPAARDDPDSPIYGMPILNVDHAAGTVVIKRSMSPGFAGIDNPLFYKDKTQMLFADAREALRDLAKAVREL